MMASSTPVVEIGESDCGAAIDLSEVSRKLQERAAREVSKDLRIVQGLELYMPLRIADIPRNEVTEKENDEDMLEAVIRFLERDPSTAEISQRELMLIQGSLGSGMSLFLRYLESHLWSSFQNAVTDFVPLCIPFRKFAFEKDGSLSISKYLEKYTDLSREEIGALKLDGKCLFLLDGFEECPLKIELWKLSDFLEWNRSRFLFTSRIGYLSETECTELLTPSAKSKLISKYIQPFSEALVEKFVAKFASSTFNISDWEAKTFLSAINQYRGLREMARFPYALSLILMTLPSLVKKYKSETKITRALIYDSFVAHLFDREFERVQLTSENLIKEVLRSECSSYAENLAFFLHSHNIFQLSQNIPALSKQAQEYLDAPSHIKQCLPLHSISDSFVEFFDHSYQDYYVSQKIFREFFQHIEEEIFLLTFEELGAECSLNQKLISKASQLIYFLADRVWEDSDNRRFENRLFHVIECSKHREDLNIAAANAITILNVAGISFHSRDFARIRIPYADLEGSVFDSASLYKADLSGVNFRNSWLESADLRESNLKDVSLGEYPYVEHPSDLFNIDVGICGKTKKPIVVSACMDSFAYIFDVEKRKLLRVVQGHSAWLWGVRISPDGNFLATAGGDTKVIVHSILGDGDPLCTFEGHSKAVYGLSWSKNGKILASGSEDGHIFLWDVVNKQQICKLTGHKQGVYNLCFSPKGDLISGGQDNKVRVWRQESGNNWAEVGQGFNGHSNHVTVVTTTSDGDIIASASKDYKIILWSGDDKMERIKTLHGHIEIIWDMCFTKDGKLLASAASDATIRLWDIAAGETFKIITGHVGNIIGLRFLPGDQRLASGARDKTLRFWDYSTKQSLRNPQGHVGWIRSLHICPEMQTVASGSRDSTIRFWDFATGNQIAVLYGHRDAVMGLEFSPDGETLISGSSDRSLILWDVNRAQQIYRKADAHQFSIHCVAFKKDGSMIASGDASGILKLWKIDSSHQLILQKTKQAHKAPMWDLEFSHDGKLLASSSSKEGLMIWSVDNFEYVRVLKGNSEGHFKFSFSPDCRKIVAGSWNPENAAYVWDVNSGQVLHRLSGHKHNIWSSRWSPDGMYIATVSEDYTCRLWDADTGDLVLDYSVHSNFVLDCWWLSDSTGIVTGSSDGTIRLQKYVDLKNPKKRRAVLVWVGGLPRLSLKGMDAKYAKNISPDVREVIRQRHGFA